MGLVLVPLFLNRSDRVLRIWIGVLLAAGGVVALATTAVAMITSAAPGTQAAAQGLPIGQESYLVSIPLRLLMWAPTLIAGFLLLTLPAAFLIGLLASRHRVLEEPGRHLPLLRRTAVVGIAIGWAFGLLQALVHVGALTFPAPAGLVDLHLYTGVFAGVGYAALFALLAHRITSRGTTPPLPVRAVVALGRRSMSGYIAQSLVWTPVLAASGLAVGGLLSSWSAMLVGIGTWLVTVVLAHAMDVAGIRGPAETLLRKLTYHPARRSARTGGDR